MRLHNFSKPACVIQPMGVTRSSNSDLWFHFICDFTLEKPLQGEGRKKGSFETWNRNQDKCTAMYLVPQINGKSLKHRQLLQRFVHPLGGQHPPRPVCRDLVRRVARLHLGLHADGGGGDVTGDRQPPRPRRRKRRSASDCLGQEWGDLRKCGHGQSCEQLSADLL